MKLPFVKRSRFESAVGQLDYWRKRSKFILNLPYITIDDIGEVQVYCEDEEQAEKIKAKLTTKQTKE